MIVFRTFRLSRQMQAVERSGLKLSVLPGAFQHKWLNLIMHSQHSRRPLNLPLYTQEECGSLGSASNLLSGNVGSTSTRHKDYPDGLSHGLGTAPQIWTRPLPFTSQSRSSATIILPFDAVQLASPLYEPQDFARMGTISYKTWGKFSL